MKIGYRPPGFQNPYQSTGPFVERERNKVWEEAIDAFIAALTAEITVTYTELEGLKLTIEAGQLKPKAGQGRILIIPED